MVAHNHNVCYYKIIKLKLFMEGIMSEKDQKKNGSDSKNDQQQKSPVYINLDANRTDVKIICDMCGHANPIYTAMCEMCSNYLTKEGK